MARTRCCLLLLLCLLVHWGETPPVGAQDGARPDAERLLESMNATVAAEALEVCDLVVKLQAEYRQINEEVRALRARLQAARPDESPDAVLADLERAAASLRRLTGLVERLAAIVSGRSEGFRQLGDVGARVQAFQAEIARSVRAAEQAAQNARQRIEELRGQLAEESEEAEKKAAEALARARAALGDLGARMDETLAAAARLENDAFRQIEALRDPAGYFQRFAEGRLREWMSKPLKAEGSDVTFRIEQVNPAQPLFGGNADLAIVMRYQERLELKASGLYFVHRPGALPEPRFDRLRVDQQSLAALGQQTLAGLGDFIPESLGLPVGIKNVRFHGFNEGDRAGGLSFDIEVGGFLDFIDGLKLSAKGVTILTNGRVLYDGGLRADIPTVIPIGTTPLILDGGWIELNPKSREETVRVGTSIATAAGGKESLSLDVTLTFGLPKPKEIRLDGVLVVGRTVKIGTIQGGMNAQRVWGKLQIPSEGSPIPREILVADLSAELNQEGLTADGAVTLFGLAGESFDLAVRLDGSGHLHAKKSFPLGIGNVEGTFRGAFHNNFTRIKIEATARVKVNLGLFHSTAVVVRIDGDNDAINVKAEAAGVKAASFTVKNLGDITIERLQQELGKQLQQGLFDVPGAIVRGVEKGFEEGSKLERKARRELANLGRQLGIPTLQTGTVLDDWGGAVSSTWQQLSSQPVATVTGGLFGKKKKSDGPSAEERKRQQLTDEFERKLDELAAACNSVDESFDPPADITSQAGHSIRRQRATGFSFDTAVAAGEGDGGGALGVVALVSGFSSSINSRSGEVDQKSDSAVLTARAHFRNLVGDQAESPTARIDVDSWNDPSGMDTPTMIRHRIQSLIELYLPEVNIEGRKQHVVKQLAVRNLTDEAVVVRVQANFRTVEQRRFVWRWAPQPPGGSEAYRFTIPPRSESPLPLRYEESDDPRGMSGPVLASRVRLWAESEGGIVWDEHRREDLWLVEENPKLGGRRAYDAESVATHVHTIVPNDAPRLFTERMLTLRNDTAETLRIELRYHTTRGDGGEGWRTLADIHMAPGTTLQPIDDRGLRVRASRILFTAKGENLVFTKHRDQSLWLVKATESGHRAYRSREIGRFVHVFTVEGRGSGETVAGR